LGPVRIWVMHYSYFIYYVYFAKSHILKWKSPRKRKRFATVFVTIEIWIRFHLRQLFDGFRVCKKTCELRRHSNANANFVTSLLTNIADFQNSFTSSLSSDCVTNRSHIAPKLCRYLETLVFKNWSNPNHNSTCSPNYMALRYVNYKRITTSLTLLHWDFILAVSAIAIVHCAGSATYQICLRLPITNPKP